MGLLKIYIVIYIIWAGSFTYLFVLRFRKKHAKLQKELEDAAKDMRGISPDRLRECVGPVLIPGAVPSKPAVKFYAHDSEVCAVRWSPVDHLVATGGADRKVKLWDISKGMKQM